VHFYNQLDYKLMLSLQTGSFMGTNCRREIVFKLLHDNYLQLTVISA